MHMENFGFPVVLSAGHSQGVAGIWGNWLSQMPLCPLVTWVFQGWHVQMSPLSPLALGSWAHTSLLLSPWIT